MQCPSCYAEIPDNSNQCPFCEETIPEDYHAAHEFQTPTSSATGSYPNSDEVLGIMDTISRPFKSPDSTNKIFIAALISLIPIIGSIFLIGYSVAYARKVIHRQSPFELPAIDDFMDLIVSGLILFAGFLIYSFVIMTISGISLIPFFGSMALFAEKAQSAKGPGVFCGLIFSTFLIPLTVIMLLSIVFSLLSPMLTIFYSRAKNFGDIFNFGQIFKLIFSDFGYYLTIFLALFILGLAVGLVVFIAAIILNLIPVLGQLALILLGTFVGVCISLVYTSAFGEYYYKNQHVLNN